MQIPDPCNKIGELVLDAIQAKHPDACAPSDIIINAYPDRPPELGPFNHTEDTAIVIEYRIVYGTRLLYD